MESILDSYLELNQGTIIVQQTKVDTNLQSTLSQLLSLTHVISVKVSNKLDMEYAQSKNSLRLPLPVGKFKILDRIFGIGR